MVESFKIKIAGVIFKINAVYDFAKEFCASFLTQENFDYEITTTEQEILAEQALYQVKYHPKYLETTCIYRHIAELLPLKNRVVMHGVALKYQQNGYLFLAPSGTGKTTHTNLWKDYLKDNLDIINGDKPILEFKKGDIILHASPWCGKENIFNNKTAELKAICLIDRAVQNTIEKIDAINNLQNLLVQVYMPKNLTSSEKTIDLVNTLCEVDLFKLHCNISKDAFILAFNTLTGEKYEN